MIRPILRRSGTAPAPAAARILDEAPGVRAMTWVMAIMLFLTILAAALGIGTWNGTAALQRQLAGRLTIQIVEGDAGARDVQATRALAALRADPAVRTARAVDRAELARLLRPWLGSDGADAELPMPAMIDVDLADGDTARAAVAARVKAVAPAARVDAHETWMSPVGSLMATFAWLAFALVALMAAATGAVVVLAARAGLDAHRPTIEVMHMLGSTDVQVARLFQRRIVRDAWTGGVVGGVMAAGVLVFVGSRVAALGSDLLGGMTLGTGGWIALALLPLAFVALAAGAARVAVVDALRRIL